MRRSQLGNGAFVLGWNVLVEVRVFLCYNNKVFGILQDTSSFIKTRLSAEHLTWIIRASITGARTSRSIDGKVWYGMSVMSDFIIGVFAIAFGLGAIIGIVFYILNGIAFYAIAKNRGYNRPWLAWIPFAKEYLKGAIADDISYRTGKSTQFRVWILVGIIVAKLGSIITTAIQLPELFAMLGAMDLGLYNNGVNLLTPRLSSAAFFSLLSLLISAISIAYSVLHYIVMYRIYKDYVPQNAVMYLVLSIIFNVTEPFFALSIRNKPAISIYGAQNPYWSPAPQPQPGYNQAAYGQGYTPPPVYNQGNVTPPVAQNPPASAPTEEQPTEQDNNQQ